MKLYRFIILSFLLLAVIGFYPVLKSTFEQVRGTWHLALDPDSGILCLAVFTMIVYRFVNSCAWTFIVRVLGHPLTLGAGARIWLVTETMRFVPGSVFSYGTRVLAAQRSGMASKNAALSVALETLLMILSWMILAVISWPFAKTITPLPGSLDLLPLAVIVGLIGLTLLPWAFRKAKTRFSAVIAFQATREQQFMFLAILGFMIAVNAFQTVSLGFLVYGIIGQTLMPADLVFANSVSFLCGLFALVAPGGIGVREAMLSAILSTFMTLPQAILLAVSYRLLQLLAEVLCLLPSLPKMVRGDIV